MTRIDLVTGILGAGKTTFIRRYAEYLLRLGLKVAILENDFGAVNVDMLLLADMESESCALEMISGCSDPSCHKRRFATKLIALGMQNFDVVIMEPSGIFDMDEFFDALHESPLDRWYRVGNILTVTDITLEDELSPQMEYLLASESAHCGRLIITRSDTVPAEERESRCQGVISHINTALSSVDCARRFTMKDVFCRSYDEMTDDDLAVLTRCEYRGASYIKRYSSEEINSLTKYFMNIKIPRDRLEEVIEGILTDRECGRIHRLKGFTTDDDGSWLKINSVGGVTEISAAPVGQSVFIIIGEELSLERIDGYFRKYNTDEGYVSI